MGEAVFTEALVFYAHSVPQVWFSSEFTSVKPNFQDQIVTVVYYDNYNCHCFGLSTLYLHTDALWSIDNERALNG